MKKNRGIGDGENRRLSKGTFQLVVRQEFED